jgi:hypothetical protein
LALASALVVLLASGVAISRMSKQDGESPVATGPSSTSSSVPGLGQPGSAGGSGPASGAGVGGAAGQAAQAAGEGAPEASGVTGEVNRTGAGPRKTTGNAGGASSSAASSSPATGGSAGSSSAPPAGSSSSGGGSAGDGQGSSPPAPSQQPPEALAAASVSAGEGAQGAVVGIGLNGGPDLDVTVGTNRVVGDHPPSNGTGATFGGRLLHPPSSLPVLPG